MTRKTLEQIWSQGAQKLFKQGANMTEEDEAFNEIERQAKQRKESVKATTHAWRESASDYERGVIDGMQKQTQSDVTRIMEGGTRNATIEEVAQEIEKFKGFGQDTIASFCIFIRNMKK